MTVPGAAPYLPRSLAARFLAIALGGVLLPLALVGLWLSRSAERAGITLLRTQLSDAAEVLTNRVSARWVLRDGDLQLLARNSSAVALLRGRELTDADRTYLRDVVRGMAPAVTEVTYRDAAGEVRWTSTDAGAVNGSPGASDYSRGWEQGGRLFAVERPVTDGAAVGGAPVGTVRAYVRLSSVLPLDSAPVLVPSSAITVLADSQRVWSSAPDTIDLMARPAPVGWAVERRVIEPAGLTIAVAAPIVSFVAPFTRVTRVGLTVLALVAVIALLLTIVLTTRVTRSLERLVVAAAAVSSGDLQRTVDVDGIDEIGRLARAFNSMTLSLRSTLAQLSEQRALAAVGEFAATLSHEVRNSLTAIRVDLQHASRYVPRTDSGGMLVGRALDSVHRLDATVTSALRVARGGAVPMEPVSIASVLERAIAVSAPVFAEREVTLEYDETAAPAVLPGDAAALEQLFVNLLLNAAQALERGGRVALQVSTRAGVSDTRDDVVEQVVVRIADNGPGMPSTAAPTGQVVFRTTKPYGTGLGLPIARRLAEMHSGTLMISDAEGGGTEVIVLLPTTSGKSRPDVSSTRGP